MARILVRLTWATDQSVRIDVVDGNDIGIPEKAVEFVAPAMMAASEGLTVLAALQRRQRYLLKPSGNSGLHRRAGRYWPADERCGSEDRSANLNIHAQSAVIDGSDYACGDDDRRQLVGEFKLNFYTPELSINACSQDSGECGSRISMTAFALELALGNKLQPVYFDVDGSGNFLIEVATIDQPEPGSIGADGLRASSDASTWDFYNEYYTNADYRSNLRIGNFSVGDRDFGSARVEGMLIQHLEIQTKDLGQ